MNTYEAIRNTIISETDDTSTNDNGLFKSTKDETMPSQPETNEKLPNPVYYVESTKDDTVLIGMDVTIANHPNGTIVSWFDTTKERMMTAEEIHTKDNVFAFKRSESEGGGYYYFRPLDLDTYNNNVKSKLIAGQDFDNQNDMIEAFLKVEYPD